MARKVIGFLILAMVLVQALRRLHPEWFEKLVESAGLRRGCGGGRGVLDDDGQCRRPG